MPYNSWKIPIGIPILNAVKIFCKSYPNKRYMYVISYNLIPTLAIPKIGEKFFTENYFPDFTFEQKLRLV